jgi:hypothetical protein
MYVLISSGIYSKAEIVAKYRRRWRKHVPWRFGGEGVVRVRGRRVQQALQVHQRRVLPEEGRRRLLDGARAAAAADGRRGRLRGQAVSCAHHHILQQTRFPLCPDVCLDR